MGEMSKRGVFFFLLFFGRDFLFLFFYGQTFNRGKFRIQ